MFGPAREGCGDSHLTGVGSRVETSPSTPRCTNGIGRHTDANSSSIPHKTAKFGSAAKPKRGEGEAPYQDDPSLAVTGMAYPRRAHGRGVSCQLLMMYGTTCHILEPPCNSQGAKLEVRGQIVGLILFACPLPRFANLANEMRRGYPPGIGHGLLLVSLCSLPS